MFKTILTYDELRREVRDALRQQHPEWIQHDGGSPMCDLYEARLTELIELFTGPASTPSAMIEESYGRSRPFTAEARSTFQ